MGVEDNPSEYETHRYKDSGRGQQRWDPGKGKGARGNFPLIALVFFCDIQVRVCICVGH